MFIITGCLSLIIAFFASLTKHMRPLVFVTMGLSLFCSIFIFADRYVDALPMMPMHLGVIGIFIVLTLIWWSRVFSIRTYVFSKEGITLQLVLVLLLAISLFFPKDFYLPFIRSLSLWSHLFFLFGTVAKGLLIYGGIAILPALLSGDESKSSLAEKLVPQTRLVIWGYGLLMLSMFSGEIWSYLGWGTPVVWQDPAITTVIGIWFYYTCYLHLHYMSSWTVKRRSFFLVLGSLMVFVLNTHQDMGPFRTAILNF